MKACPHCGSEIEGGKPRSIDQLRRFFGMVRAMFAHWPDSAEFQPDTPEHLRKWALIKAGHREATDIDIAASASQTKILAAAIEGALKAAGAHAFVRPDPHGGRVRIFRAKSIAFAHLGQAEFNRLNDEVENVYRAETGLDPDEVLKEQERAA